MKTNNKHKVSIIITIYNVEKYLDKCINSCISQTYSNLQIILVDDGSTDNSYICCKKWADFDRRIEVIRKKNGGLSSARNVGLTKSNGEYILFVSKTIGVPIAKIATWIMTGSKLKDFNLTKEIKMSHVAVKEAVFPFLKLPEADTILGPEMKSTGESIGIDDNFSIAFYKSQLSAGMDLPKEGKIFISIKEKYIITSLYFDDYNMK